MKNQEYYKIITESSFILIIFFIVFSTETAEFIKGLITTKNIQIEEKSYCDESIYYYCGMAAQMLRKNKFEEVVENSIMLPKNNKKYIRKIKQSCISESSIKGKKEVRIDHITKGILMVTIIPNPKGTALGESCIVQHQGQGQFEVVKIERNILNWQL